MQWLILAVNLIQNHPGVTPEKNVSMRESVDLVGLRAVRFVPITISCAVRPSHFRWYHPLDLGPKLYKSRQSKLVTHMHASVSFCACLWV